MGLSTGDLFQFVLVVVAIIKLVLYIIDRAHAKKK